MKNISQKAVVLCLVASLLAGPGIPTASADIELPVGTLSGCPLFVPSLEKMSRSGVFGPNKASKILRYCVENFKTLETNRLVSTKDFVIDYEDDCTYVKYSREREIENLLAKLIN